MQSEPAAASCLPIQNEFVKFFRAANADTCIEHLYYFQECSLSAATVRHTQFYNPPHRTLSEWGKPNVHRQQKSLLVHPLYSLLHLHDSIGQWISDKWHSRHVIWPDFCSALIVGRLAPLGLHNTRFRSVPVSCSPRTGADASSSTTRPTGTSPIPGPSNPGRACVARRARSCTRR